MDELVVFLMREFGWELEYTTKLVQTLPVKKLNALVKEVQYQKSVEDYQTATNFAMIIANWASAQSKNKNYKVIDFIGKPPNRTGESGTGLRELAQKEGIIMPSKGG